MKNAHKLLVLLFFTTLFFSCTPQSISEDESGATQNVFATGGDESSEVDDDRD